MDKAEVRREFFKLRVKQKSYSKIQKLLKDKFGHTYDIRTLKRWQKRFNDQEIWDYLDISTRPNHIYYKVTVEDENLIIRYRKKYGWGAKKIAQTCKFLDLSAETINLVLRRNGLVRKEHIRGQRAKYVRFERNHPNSLWHIDDSEFGDSGKIIAVIDDYSRYCVGILHSETVTTHIATQFLDHLIVEFGSPKQIISDNGSPYGGKSKWSKFDVWCRRRNIEHIRTKVKRPQTNGKVERLFGTIDAEIKFCNGDLDMFRMRYNHFRPHQSLGGKTPSFRFNKEFLD